MIQIQHIAIGLIAVNNGGNGVSGMSELSGLCEDVAPELGENPFVYFTYVAPRNHLVT